MQLCLPVNAKRHESQRDMWMLLIGATPSHLDTISALDINTYDLRATSAQSPQQMPGHASASSCDTLCVVLTILRHVASCLSPTSSASCSSSPSHQLSDSVWLPCYQQSASASNESIISPMAVVVSHAASRLDVLPQVAGFAVRVDGQATCTRLQTALPVAESFTRYMKQRSAVKPIMAAHPGHRKHTKRGRVRHASSNVAQGPMSADVTGLRGYEPWRVDSSLEDGCQERRRADAG